MCNLFATRGFDTMAQPQPTTTPRAEEPKFGFNDYSERLNGRAAMLGFTIMVVIEYLTGQGLLTWLGLQ
ncbi:chlorophyll a/b-binding protein [Limnofasciculus baicalensis]|nr:chlorophyll a/b-binding protein [Limnofasciculus baicalensis]